MCQYWHRHPSQASRLAGALNDSGRRVLTARAGTGNGARAEEKRGNQHMAGKSNGQIKAIETKFCAYCNAVVTTKGEGDHFPLPRRHGGIETVPCCESCHAMKDTIALGSWPVEWIAAVAADMPKLSRETKLFLAKVVQLASDVLLEHGGQNGKV